METESVARESVSGDGAGALRSENASQLPLRGPRFRVDGGGVARDEGLPERAWSRSEARVGERRRWWRDRRRRRLLAAADAVVALLIGVVVAQLEANSVIWAPVAVPVGLVAAKLLGLYDADHRAIRHLTVDEIPTLTVWCAVIIMFGALISPGTVSFAELGLTLLPLVVASALLRGAARLAWRATTPPESTLVVGAGEPAASIARKIELFADMHLKLERVEDPADHLEYRNGDEDQAMEHALSGIDRVVLAWSDADPLFIERLLGHCRRLEVKLSVISPFRGRARPSLQLSQVADLPVLEYNTWDVPRSTAALKRVVDLSLAGFALVVLAPVFAAIALAIKLDDRGPVLFRQRRAGKDQMPFTMLKFRSMCVDAEERLPGLVNLDDLESPMFKLFPDPRVTRVGALHRRFSLDELPQLFNVVRGDMSLVGPRPEEVLVADRYEPEHTFRLSVRPGITGPMQVFGRGELSFEERLAVEIDYLENLSITRDLALLVQTLPAVIRGTGAF